MQKSKYIWFNGKFIHWEAAKIHLLTHSLHYGSAVFEGIRFYETTQGPAVFRLDDHLSRLFFSAKAMDMKVLYSKSQLKKSALELIKRNNLKAGYLRPIIFFGEKMGLNPIGADLNVVLAVWPWPKYLEGEVIKVKISRFQRIQPGSSLMGAKISGHYFNSILATLDAKKAGFDEALLLDWQGNIAEGPGENVFFVKGKNLITPKAGAILPGITRDSIIKIAKDLGLKVIEKNIRPKDIKKFDEAFFCGTAVEIAPIGQIDKIKIGRDEIGPVTKEIQKAYQDVVRGENNKYQKWLSPIQ